MRNIPEDIEHEIVESIVENMETIRLLDIPGVYDSVKEYYADEISRRFEALEFNFRSY